MGITQLVNNPSIFFIWLLAVLYGITVHEFCHAWLATREGDPTPGQFGRLTLNPFAHLDILGLFMLVFVGFGWGKPVPVNPYNLKRGKFSDNLVSLAGIFANLISVIVFIIVIKLFLAFSSLGADNLLLNFLVSLIMVNLVLALFNIIPIPPLDGSHVLFNLLPEKYNNAKVWLAKNGPLVLLGILVLDSFTNLNIFGRLFGFFINFVYSLI